ncbi:D-alanine--D-alanine ligase [Alistipes sp. OttesenSCG-928-B03]|nr:D-alanine--D-alanine ligase [Alistipes sp. OttesenSCG-928-B03]
MNKLNIALMAGGDSSEREVSLGSAAQVYEALDKAKYNVFLIDVLGRDWVWRDGKGGDWQVDRNDFSLTANGRKTAFDYALILIHGTPGEDGRLQGYFDFMGVPYSSCDMVSAVITFDKETCKRAVADADINLAREVFIRRGERVDPAAIAAELGLPVFVKPNASGSSFGVTKVKRQEDIAAAVEAAFAESNEVLIEEFVAGREIACGVMVTRTGEEYVFPLTEIIPQNEFFDYEAKYTAGKSDEITPADIDEPTADRIRAMALRAYSACRCRGICRVDFIVRQDGEPVMIEINSVPGMSAGSIVPKQAAHAGMTLGELFDIVIGDTYTAEK